VKIEIKERWLEALRSGNYKQGARRLRGTDDTFCCLGVLCDLAEQEGVVTHELPESPNTSYAYAYIGTRAFDEFEFSSTTTLPKAVATWAGLDSGNPSVVIDDEEERSLAGINDEGADFSEIADLIEEHL
jgi:hypothetical protein